MQEKKNRQQKKDILDTKMNIKKFFKLIYRDIDLNNEYIRMWSNNATSTKESTYSKAYFYNDIDDLVEYATSKYINYNNTYFQLNSCNGNGKANNVQYAYCLGFDFDKKDIPNLDIDYIKHQFRKHKLSYHILIDSGNGYHAYILLNKTNKLDMVQEVYRTLASKLKADINACKPTQLLRIPYTKNIKGYSKTVKIVSINDRNNFGKYKPYDIEFLHKMNCKNKPIKEQVSSNQTQYTLNDTNLHKCLEIALLNGTEEGQRYNTLENIVVALKNANKPYNEIVKVVKEWANKSNYNDNLDYRVKYAYDNKLYLQLSCTNCEHWDSCKNRIISDFEYAEDEQLITLNESNMSKLKHSDRKGVKVMNGNELLIYCLLYNHSDGLSQSEIMQELTYVKKKKVKNIAMNEKTLRKVLKSLEDNKFIDVVKGNARAKIPNIYKLKEDRSKSELKYNVSVSATYECIKGRISTEEFRLYNYMRYLHHKEQREGTSTLKGNLFQINQVKLAKDFGVTQGRISQMIESLLDEKLLSIWYREASKNNGFDYYIYRLNY